MNKKFSTQEIHFGFSLAREVFSGAVFGESLDISQISETRLIALITDVHEHSAKALNGLAEYQPKLVKNLLDKTILKSVAFVSAVAYELLLDDCDLDALAKAGAAMALVQIADHLMDRGDAKMVAAISAYFMGEAPENAEVQARSDILDAIATLAKSLSEDEGLMIAEAMLAILRDELAVFQLSKHYFALTDTAEQQSFLVDYACEIAELSIRNVGLRPASFMVYSCYRLLNPNLRPLQAFIQHSTIDKLSYFGEWAIRLWDDFGDQEIDTGQVYSNSYSINPFVLQDEHLSDAYFLALEDRGIAFNLINALSRKKYDALNKLIILYLQSINSTIPTMQEDESIYINILRRIIEGGFVNSLGDEGISYTEEIIADYR